MNLHIVMHESFENPGAVVDWAKKRNHNMTYTRVYEHQSLPTSCDTFDFLIVMGGPQSPATTSQECPHFNAKQEITLIKKAIQSNKLVLGVCLGAQLIGEALGASFEHSPNKEIGVFPLTLTGDAKQDPIFSKFPRQFLVGHWHGDMPGLTPTAKVLAKSEGCPRQVVRYLPNVYGFQCHFEFTAESIEGMIKHCGHELNDTDVAPYIQSAAELRKHKYTEMNQLLFDFLDELQTLKKSSDICTV